MRAAGYLRVSTDAQAGEDRFGLESQPEAVRGFALQTRWATPNRDNFAIPPFDSQVAGANRGKAPVDLTWIGVEEKAIMGTHGGAWGQRPSIVGCY
jgi:hypothetical protein